MKAHTERKFRLDLIVGMILAALIGYALVYAAGEAQWNSGSPILVDAGAFVSYGTKTSDGFYIIAAEDAVPTVQKFNDSGVAQWNGGTPVDITGYDNLSEIVADASGGAFVLHGGPNVSNSDVYLTHVDSAGSISWTAGPMDTTTDFWPRVIHDGSGGAYVAWWRTDRTTLMTHIGSDGDVCDVATCGVDWNSGGSGTYKALALPTSPTSPTRPEPRMALSDSGSVIVPYVVDSGIDVVKISSAGATLWGAVSISDSNYYYMAEPDGSDGIFIAYWHNEIADRELKVARIDSTGAFQVGSGAGGVVVKTLDSTFREVYALVSASDNAGSFFLGWTEEIVSTGEYVSFVQKYNTSGAEQWTVGGVQLFPSGDGLDDFFEDTFLFNLPHNLVSDGTGGAIAGLYTFGGAIASTVVVQRVTSAGTLDWGTSGFYVTEDTANDNDFQQDVISDGAGGVVVNWYQDFTDIVVQYVKTAATAPSGGGGSKLPEYTCGTPPKAEIPKLLEVIQINEKPAVYLNWFVSGEDDDLEIDIHRDGKKIDSAKKGVSTYVDSGVKPNACNLNVRGGCKIKNYNYQVKVRNTCGNEVTSDIGKAGIDPLLPDGTLVDVWVDITLNVKDAFSSFFNQKLQEMIELGAPTGLTPRSFGKVGIFENLGIDELRTSTHQAARARLLSPNSKELIENFFLGHSHAASVEITLKNKEGKIINGPMEVRTNILGEINELYLGKMNVGEPYTMEIKLADELYVLPKIFTLKILNAQPVSTAEGLRFEKQLILNFERDFCFGDFQEDGDIDLMDMFELKRIIEREGIMSINQLRSINIDGIDGFNLEDYITMLKNFTCRPEVELR